MNKEQRLKEIANALEEHSYTKAPPIFELFAAIVAMSISTLLFVLVGVFEQDATFYELMRMVMPQTGWAATYFVVGIVAAAGLIFDKKTVRIISLGAMAATFGLTTVFYLMTFPNLSGILMFWITIFTIISIPMVKFTGLKYKK